MSTTGAGWQILDDLAAQQLAHLVVGERSHPVEGHGNLVRRQMRSTQRGERRLVGVTDEDGDGNLTQAIVRPGHDRGLRDARVEAQHLLHLLGEHLVPAPVDQIRRPPFDPDEALGIDPCVITRADEALRVDPIVQLRPARVPGRHAGRTDQQFADRTVGDGAAFLVDHRDVHPGMRSPRRAQLLRMLAGVRRRPPDDLAHLGLAVAVQHRHAEPVHEPARGQRRQRRRDAADESEGREVGHRRVRRSA